MKSSICYILHSKILCKYEGILVTNSLWKCQVGVYFWLILLSSLITGKPWIQTILSILKNPGHKDKWGEKRRHFYVSYLLYSQGLGLLPGQYHSSDTWSLASWIKSSVSAPDSGLYLRTMLGTSRFSAFQQVAHMKQHGMRESTYHVSPVFRLGATSILWQPKETAGHYAYILR